MAIGSVASASYDDLLKKVRGEILRARADIACRTLKTYWAVGRFIDSYTRRYGGRCPWGGNIYAKLAEDLQMNERVLYSIVQFYRTYPDQKALKPISWSHYRYLSMVPDAKERKHWEERILGEQLSLDAFIVLLKGDCQPIADASLKGAVLPVARGLLYHYRIIKVSDIAEVKDGMMVDCGFENRIAPPVCKGVIDNSRIVESVREEGGYRLKLSKATVGEIYTYAAVVERVIDADTLLVNIDCGFGIWRREKVRLKAIDAPEKATIPGLAATQWVERELASCSPVVIRSSKSDKYDRYLADVFYLKEVSDPNEIAAHGEYLNQKLLDLGYARLWQ